MGHLAETPWAVSGCTQHPLVQRGLPVVPAALTKLEAVPCTLAGPFPRISAGQTQDQVSRPKDQISLACDLPQLRDLHSPRQTEQLTTGWHRIVGPLEE